MNKKDYKEFGKQGANKRWVKRYEILKELSSYGDKEWQNKIIKWPTKYLEILLAFTKK